MAYYEKFRTNNRKNTYKVSNGRRHFTTNDKKTLLVNSPLIIIVVLILLIAFVFGIYKANESNISRLIQNATSHNLTPKESLTETAIESNAQQESFLKLPFKLFAKPEGDNGPVQEVTTDDGDDVVSTIIRQSAMSYMTNENNDLYISKESLSPFIPKSHTDLKTQSVYEKTNNFEDASENNDEVKKTETALLYSRQATPNYSSENSTTNTKKAGKENIITPNPFAKILSPKNDKIKENIISSKPARTPRREIPEMKSAVNEKSNTQKIKQTETYTQVSSANITQRPRIVINQNEDDKRENRVADTAKTTSQNKNQTTQTKEKTQTITLKPARVERTRVKDKTLKEIEKTDNRIHNKTHDSAEYKPEAKKTVVNNRDYYIKQENLNDNNQTNNINQIYSQKEKSKENIKIPEKTESIKQNNSNLKTEKVIYAPQENVREARENNRGQNESVKENAANISVERSYTTQNSSVQSTRENRKENIIESNTPPKTETLKTATVTRDNNWKVDTVKSKKTLAPRNTKLKPSIYLAEYDDKYGTITIVPRERNVGNDVGIEALILSLLEGANEKEYQNNIVSCIAKGTSLLDVFTDGDTAYLNFSSDFEYNPLGDEGLVIQIYQIVYTVTQFSNINKVVFLIDGERKDFIGSEGRLINKAFTRNVDNTIITSE